MPYSDTVPIEGFTATVGTTPLAEKLKKDRFVLDEIDWFWRNFMSDDGKGLYGNLVEPITGDFNRIAENGEAWRHVSTQFQSLSKNLTDNTATLLTEHWTRGEASGAFHNYIEINWVGALFIAEQLSEYMGKGFDKISEWSIKLAEKAVELLSRVLQRILELSQKFVPVLGQAAGVFEWVMSGFKDFPYWSDVEDIIGIVQQIYSIHSKIEELAGTITGYLSACQSMLDAVSTIPEINSTQDVVQITKTMQGGQQEIQEKQEEFDKKKGELDGQISDLDQKLNPPAEPVS